MRGAKEGTSGRVRNAVLTVVAASAVLTFCFWPKAEATPSAAEQLEAVARSPIGDNRRRAVIDQLAKLDSSEARNRVKDLADSPNDRIAVLALGAMCRTRFDGAENKVKSVFEDTHRSSLLRGMALAAYCEMKKHGGASWSDIKGYVKQRAGSDQVLTAQYAASKARLWASEVDNDR